MNPTDFFKNKKDISLEDILLKKSKGGSKKKFRNR